MNDGSSWNYTASCYNSWIFVETIKISHSYDISPQCPFDHRLYIPPEVYIIYDLTTLFRKLSED